MVQRDRGAGSADSVGPAPIAYLPWVQPDAESAHTEESATAAPVRRSRQTPRPAPALGEYIEPERPRADFGSETEFSLPPTEPGLEQIALEIAAADRADALVLKKLARHGLSEHEVRQQLRVELDEPDVEAAIERYLRLGYIDDERLAESLVRHATSRRGLGPAGIRRDLLARGLDAELVTRALVDLDAEVELERAIELIARKAERSSEPKHVLERRLTAMLQRKGYSSSITRRAVDHVLSS